MTLHRRSSSAELYEVRLNVYDLSEYNSYLFPLGIGIHHSGVEVHGREYCFGGHDGRESGVFTMRPRVGVAGITLRESILLGRTRLSEVEVHRLAVRLGRNSFCRQICGAKIPKWINRLAYLGTLLPPSWLPIISNVPVAPDPGVDDGRPEQ